MTTFYHSADEPGRPKQGELRDDPALFKIICIAWALCGLVMLMGAAVLFGWALDITLLKSLLPEYVTVKANTAIGMILLATATAATLRPHPKRWRLWLAYGCAAFAALLAVLTLLEYSLHVDYGIDQFLFIDRVPLNANFPPGRFAPITAVCFIMIAIALVAQTNSYRPFISMSRFFLWLSLLLAFQALVSYILDVKFLFGKAFYTQMAVHTTIMFIALCSALLAGQRLLRPKEDSPSAAADAVFQRRLVAAAIVIPPMMQCLLQMGRRAGYFVDDFGVVLQVAGNSILMLVIINWSLTSLQARAGQIRQSETSFAKLTEALPQIIWTTRADGTIEYCNSQWRHYTGMSQEQTYHVSWLAFVHADELPFATATWQASMQRKEPFQFEYRLRRHDGTHRWHITRAIPVRDSADRVTRWFATSTDIDDIKALSAEKARLQAERLLARAAQESEERLQIMLEGAFDAVVSMEANGNVAAWNGKAEQMFGWSKKEAIGQPLAALIIPPELRAAHAHGLAHYFATGHGKLLNCEVEVDACRSDGSLFPVRLVITPVEVGGKVSFTSFITDTTARRRAEAELRAAQARAEQAAMAKSQFLAHMSHEVRTPLNGILGVTDMLLDEHVSEAQRHLIEVLRGAGIQLLEIVNDILDFSKVEAGRLELEMVPLELRELVAQRMALMRSRAQAKTLGLSCHIADDVPNWMLGDPGRLGQIFLNLLSNAIKFTEKGDVSVRVTCVGQCVRFAFHDSGMGIPDDVRNRLFLPFSQADTSTSRRYGGTGLGLAICHQLVALMGGSLDFSSTVGKGSIFWVDVPLVIARKPEAAQINPPDAPHAPITIRGKRPAVLVAEDNEVNRLVVSAHLRKLGCDARLVTNGQEAVTAFKSQAFDLVLMDCHMPEMDGFAATSVIRAYEHDTQTHTPIVALTASALAEDVERCLRAGMDAHLCKPLRLDIFAVTIKKYTSDA